jgi:hypothetical protein
VEVREPSSVVAILDVELRPWNELVEELPEPAAEVQSGSWTPLAAGDRYSCR